MNAKNSHRIFVAIELSPKVKASLRHLQDQYRETMPGGRYEDVNNLHITLAFIGETDRTDDVVKAISEIQFEPFEIDTTHVGRFQTRHGCDLLWMGLSNEAKLGALSSAVKSALDSIGVEYSQTPFKPHITLIKDTEGWPFLSTVSVKMKVDKINVMETTMVDGHIKYITL